MREAPIDGAVIADVARQHGMGAGGLKGLLVTLDGREEPFTEYQADAVRDAYRESLVRDISDFAPAVSGTICDRCNKGFGEGEDVLVVAWHYDGAWHLTETMCPEHEPAPGTGATWAVARCELGPVQRGEFAPLYNPDVVDVHIPEVQVDE